MDDEPIAFGGAIFEWRGPAPFLFVAVPDEHIGAIRYAGLSQSYGWGVVPVASWGMMAAGIAGLFLANPIVTAEGLDAKAWLALSYIVLAGTVAAFWLYLACLKYISPVTAGLVVCLEPTSAYVFGIMFMNLKLGWIECLGIAMVISQVFILSIRSKKRS